MLSVDAFARAPAESLLRVYERRKQQQPATESFKLVHCSLKRIGDVDPAGVVNLSLDG